MDNNTAISLVNLSKTFKIVENRNYTLRGAISNLFKQENIKYVPALKNLNIDIKKGEKIGVVGTNGSGKSTLLKIIGGIYPPDKGGKITIDGKCIRLALGTGFNFDFSARQNIYINGSLLGMSFKQIGERFQDIIDLAELHEFVDTKLKFYSSGMKMRLSFAIAMYVESDIFLIDEFFGGVGDENFRRKSNKIFQSSIIEGKTIINVSHSMEIIRQNSDRVIWMDKGDCKMIDKTNEVLEKYLASFEDLKNKQD
ncbi:MAG: ATP-binding cassette domain-containing protein [Bacteroidales bacterium]|nr:ATP-binding cassette domain-containing protein [Bacteroidales bacterium]